jgi:L-Ala-D/L-Glu epimerase
MLRRGLLGSRTSMRIVRVTHAPLDIELREPFGVAGGAQLHAHNVLARVELDDGTVGLGEGAPFPAISGETQASTSAALGRLSPQVVGEDVERWLELAASLAEAEPAAPAARCAVEAAMLDALTRARGQSLWRFFGAGTAELDTDVTIPTGSRSAAASAARRAAQGGFATLKLKVGAESPEEDAARLRAAAAVAPRAEFVVDANEGFDSNAALAFLDACGDMAARISLFEQPTTAEDLDGARRVRERGAVRVAADESARSAADVAKLAAARAADVINIKIMKSGIAEALKMIAAAKEAGLGLMIGGMVEAEMAMTVSGCLAAGDGAFTFVDLDTPLFLRDSPCRGGWQQDGPRLRFDMIESGHGVLVAGANP